MNVLPKVPPDFPDWLGPMLVKELRQGLKARSFVLTFIGLQIVLVLVTIYHALLYAKNPPGFDGGAMGAIFWMLIAVQLIVITPVRALGVLANERKANTLELIYMTGLTSWRIAWGKWVSLMFQALLFLLAVLPYAILRYFFGSMNLAEELMSLAMALLLCGIFSAVALGVSGMPLPIRVVFFCVAVFLGMSVMPVLLFGAAMRAGSTSPFAFLLTIGYGWILILYNTVLLIAGSIEVAAATISPPAGLGAMRLRMMALLTWLPIPILFAFNVPEEGLWAQIGLACSVSGLLCWHQLSVAPEVMRSHLEPYARAQRVGPLIGAFFIPGWPSAILFLILVEALAFVSIRSLPASASNPDAWLGLTAILFLGGAALMTPPLLWQAIGRRPQWPFVAYTVVLILAGSLYSFHDAINLTPQSQPGHFVALAYFPPIGIWAMVDDGLREPYLTEWWGASLIAFFLYATGLLLFSRSYWVRVWQLSKSIGNPVTKPTTSLPVAA